MTATTIELQTPAPGDTKWRISIDGGPKFMSSIPLAEPTQKVVEKLRRAYRPMQIKAPTGATIYPKPPGGWPHLVGQTQ